MSYYTELNIGLWNAWIGGVIPLLSHMLIYFIDKKSWKRLGDMSWYTPADKIAAYASMIMMYGMILFSVWVPLKTGTVWFYSGIVLFCISYICYVVSYRNYATTPLDEAIVKGLYRFSRNPLYFFYSLMMLSLCVMSASLYLFLIWIVYNISVHFIVLGEEKYCLTTYGYQYRVYMKNSPRYFLFF